MPEAHARTKHRRHGGSCRIAAAFRRQSSRPHGAHGLAIRRLPQLVPRHAHRREHRAVARLRHRLQDRKSTRLNSSHGYISYAVFCLKKKKQSVTRFCLPEYGTMCTLALVRFAVAATKEIKYIIAIASLTYTDLAVDNVFYCILSPRD